MIAALAIVPFLVGLAIFALPRSSGAAARAIGVVVSLFVLVGAFVGAGYSDEATPWFAHPFVASFHVGIGGVSLWLVALLGLITACAAALTRVPQTRDLVAQLLLLEGSMAGLFIARDLLLFALFWDLMLVPVFLVLVAAPSSAGSAWRYLIYNLAGGLALLLGVAAYGMIAGTTDVIGRNGALAPIPAVAAAAIFGALAFAFAVKTPVWPLHTWMPDTYCDLPPPLVAVVSAIQSKAGLYGLLAVGYPLFAGPAAAAAPVFIVLGLVGLFYGAFTALVLDDAKRVVAYSSLSHLGLILFALASGDPLARAGALIYIVAHALFSAGLFLVLGEVEQREETRSLSRLGGLGVRDPRLAGALLIVSLAALGLPGLCGFAGELTMLIGTYRSGLHWETALALVAVVLAAAYFVRFFQMAMHGPELSDLPVRPDLHLLEIAALAPLVIAFVVIGVAPGLLLGRPLDAPVTAGTNAALALGVHR